MLPSCRMDDGLNRRSVDVEAATPWILSFFLWLATFRMRASAWDTLSPFCAWRVFCCPLGPRPSLLRLRSQSPGFVRRSLSYYGGSDFPRPFVIGYRSSPPRCRPATCDEPAKRGSPGSRATSFHTCQVLRPRRASRSRPCLHRLPPSQRRRHPGYESLRGSMAGLCGPCQRFAAALAGDRARLGVDVDRYSFIVSDHRV